MSNQSAVAALVPAVVTDKNGAVTPILLPANVRKVHVTVDRAAAFSKILPRDIAADAQCAPRNISGNVATARAAVGGGVTPVSFLTGVAWIAASHAFGSIGTVDTVIDGLPIHAQYAVRSACALIKRGAGITREALESACIAGLEAMLALPSPTKATKQGAVSAPLVVAAGATVAGEKIGMDEKAINSRNLDADRADRRADEKIIDFMTAHAKALADAEAALIAETAAKAETETALVRYSVGAASSAIAQQIAALSSDDAERLLRALAARHGFTLVRAIPEKQVKAA